MALFDFLKRKKEIQKAKESSGAKTKREKKIESKTEASPKKEPPYSIKSVEGKEKTSKKQRQVKDFSYNLVKEPHISEKATLLGELDKYVFKVQENANKSEIKKSIEGIYGVTVTAVKIVKIPKKKRRLGRTEGFKKGFKKALVTIQEGQKIEIF